MAIFGEVTENERIIDRHLRGRPRSDSKIFFSLARRKSRSLFSLLASFFEIVCIGLPNGPRDGGHPLYTSSSMSCQSASSGQLQCRIKVGAIDAAALGPFVK